MTDYTKENDWVHDMVMACKQDPNNSDINIVALYHVIDLIRQDEREACAKLCESEGHRIDASWESCATAIRARGEK